MVDRRVALSHLPLGPAPSSSTNFHSNGSHCSNAFSSGEPGEQFLGELCEIWNLGENKKNVVELTWKCHSASVAIDWTFTVPSLYTVYNISTRRHDQSHCCPNHFFRAVSFQFQTICPSSHSKTGIPAAPLRSCMRPFWNSCRSSDVRDVAINKYFRHQITKLHDSFLAGNKCKILQKCLYMLVPYLGPT